MPAILYELDRLMDEHDARNADKRKRRNIADAAFNAHRRKALADRSCSNLRRRRLTFREDGLTVDQLSERSTVAGSVIRALETGDQSAGSDQTWQRLALALSCRRADLDPSWIYGS